MKKVVAFLSAAAVLLSLSAVVSAGETRDSVTCATNMVISTIDPWDEASLQNNQVRRQIYEPLYYFNDLTGEYEARVATDYEVSEDGCTYTFTIRTDGFFQNGDPITVEDVVWSYEKACATPILATATSAITNVEAVDDSHVAISTAEPNAPFMMNQSIISIASKKACEEAGDALGSSAVLCGTGPFYVEEYNPDVQIVLKAFPDYYRGEAAIKTLTFKPILDSSTGLIAFENGELDFYNIPTGDWAEISESGKYNTELIEANHDSFLCVNFTGPLANPLVREAIAHCINKEEIIIGAYDGLAAPANCIVNNHYVVGAPEETIVYDYDIDKAKELLAEAGYPDGVDVGTIRTIPGTYFEKIALIVQDSLSRAGITVTMDSMEQAASIAALNEGDFDLFTTGYNGQYDYDFWKLMTHSDAVETASVKFSLAPEEAEIPWQDIDRLFDEGAKELDPEKRAAIYKEVDDMCMETCTYLPIFYKQVPYAWNIDLNAVPHSNYYMVYEWSWNN